MGTVDLQLPAEEQREQPLSGFLPRAAHMLPSVPVWQPLLASAHRQSPTHTHRQTTIESLAVATTGSYPLPVSRTVTYTDIVLELTCHSQVTSLAARMHLALNGTS